MGKLLVATIATTIGMALGLWYGGVVTNRQKADLLVKARSAVLQGVIVGYQCRGSGRSLADCKFRAEQAMDGVVQ